MAGNSEAYEHVGGHGDVSGPDLNEVHAVAGYGGGERVPTSHDSDPPRGRDRRTRHFYAAAGGGSSSLEVRTVGWRQQGQRAGRVDGQGFPEHHPRLCQGIRVLLRLNASDNGAVPAEGLAGEVERIVR